MGMMPRQFWALVVGATVSVLVAQSASATAILTFTENGTAQAVVGTQSGGTSTQILITNAPIIVGGYAGGGTPFNAFLNLTANSTGTAVDLLGVDTQSFTGMFAITSGTGGTGTNYLSSSGTWTDVVAGLNGGQSLTMTIADPPASLLFTSSILPSSLLILPTAMSLAFSNVIPNVNITGTTTGSFSSIVAGNFSAGAPAPVPEPGSLILVGSALVGVVTRFRRRRR